MNGVDILATEEVATKHALNGDVFWTISIVIAVIALSIFVYFTARDGFECVILSATLALAGLGLLCGFVFGMIFSTPEKIETQYKVTISDEVKMTDFLERYEIIDTEGKIYTVREKGVDEN